MKIVKFTKGSRANKINVIANYIHNGNKVSAKEIAIRYKCTMSYAYSLIKDARALVFVSKLGALGEATAAASSKLLIAEAATSALSAVEAAEAEARVDMVNHPPHYTVGGIEVIDYIQAKLTPEEFRGYLKGNVLKYTSRAGHKDDAVQDVDKLVWYANKLKTVS